MPAIKREGDAAQARARQRHRLVALAAYALAAAVSFVPVLFLSFGVQALGDRLGWWDGDPNSNDGEEFFATALGGGAFVLILVITGVSVARDARRRDLSAFPSVALGTLAVVIAFALYSLWAFEVLT